jgi:hypothetical protein
MPGGNPAICKALSCERPNMVGAINTDRHE